jgi:hypothetical protein
MEVRDNMPVVSTSVPSRRRTARRVRRGVGMKGTARSMMSVVFITSKERDRALWL